MEQLNLFDQPIPCWRFRKAECWDCKYWISTENILLGEKCILSPKCIECGASCEVCVTPNSRNFVPCEYTDGSI